MTGIERIIVVGAGLAGLAGADELRRHGFTGDLVVVGDEIHLPYDRPPLSKAIPAGRLDPTATELPQTQDLDITWRTGVRATALDRSTRTLALSTGERLPFDRLLIATGVRAVPWPDQSEAGLRGVLSIRTREDAAALQAALAARPRRVVVVGAGFIGSEVASACRDLGLPVTVVERAEQPLENALGRSVGAAIAALQRAHDVDLRLQTKVEAIIDDGTGQVAQVRLSDGQVIDADVVVASLGSRRNVEWLDGAGLMADRAGVGCDATMRVVTADGVVDNAVYAAGDVARWPHPVFASQFVAVEHWDAAVGQARHAARNMIDSIDVGWLPTPYADLPRFWSNQFGVNIKSLGIPRFADTIVLAEGSLENRRGVVVYGRDGHTVAAVALNAPRELEGYATAIRRLEKFPPRLVGWRGRAETPEPVPARFPGPGGADHDASASVVGPAPADPLAALGLRAAGSSAQQEDAPCLIRQKASTTSSPSSAAAPPTAAGVPSTTNRSDPNPTGDGSSPGTRRCGRSSRTPASARAVPQAGRPP